MWSLGLTSQNTRANLQQGPYRDAKILITGASSGIGQALAEALAGPGITLGLVARRSERLAQVRAAAEADGAKVATYTADVTDTARMTQIAAEFTSMAGGVTHAFANAGTSNPDRVLEGDPSKLVHLMNVNVIGVINTLMPLVPTMKDRGRGHLVAISSVAGFRALPGQGGYCASKAAVMVLMDGFRPKLAPHGIQVTTICPGFIHTELTANNKFPMPFIMGADKAARLMLEAVAKGKRTYVLPWQMRMIVPLLTRVPDALLSYR